jgi:hypothetical protein
MLALGTGLRISNSRMPLCLYMQYRLFPIICFPFPFDTTPVVYEGQAHNAPSSLHTIRSLVPVFHYKSLYLVGTCRED